MKWLVLTIYAVALMVLTGCGGDSSSSSSTSQNTPSAVAHAANLTITYSPETSMSTISWDESAYKDAKGYRLEKQDNNLSSAPTALVQGWSEVITLASGAQNYSVNDYSTSSTTYRVVAISDSTPLASADLSTQVTSNPVDTITTYFSNGDTNLSLPLNKSATINTLLPANLAVQKVIYYIDTQKVGESATAPNYPLSVNFAAYTNGNHRLDSQLQLSPSNFIKVSTPISTYNTNLNLSLSLRGSAGVIPLIATASSQASINGVNFYVDGALVANVSTKNYCASKYGCNGTYDSYKWDWNTNNYSPKTYQLRADVSDNGGESQSKTLSYDLNNPPQLFVTSPLDNSIVGDTLTISGSATDDQPNTTVTISVGDQVIYNSTSSTFSVSYNMNGLAEKQYSIQIKAVDAGNKSTVVTRSVLYKAGSTVPVWKVLGAGTTLLTLNNGYLVSQNANTITKLNLSTQAQSTYDLSLVAARGLNYLDVSNNGKLLFYGSTDQQVSQIFLGSNTLSNLGDGQHPIVYGNRGLWINSAYSQMNLYSLDTQQTIQVPKPSSETGFWLNNSYFMSDTHFCDSAQSNYGSKSRYNVYLYSIANNTTTQITNTPDLTEVCKGLDSTRLIYVSSDNYDSSIKQKLYYVNINQPTSSILLSDNVSGTPQLSDGIIAWVDGTNNALYALFANQSSPVKIADNAQLGVVKDGMLTYIKDGKLYLYKNATATQIMPSSDRHFIDGGYVYIIKGTDGLIYRVQ